MAKINKLSYLILGVVSFLVGIIISTFSFNKTGGGFYGKDVVRADVTPSPGDPSPSPDGPCPDGPGPCFPKGTLVLTPDGVRPIETITAGSRILSYDRFGSISEDVVTRLFVHPKDNKNEILVMALTDGFGKEHHLSVTGNHPMYSPAKHTPKNDIVEKGLYSKSYKDDGDFKPARDFSVGECFEGGKGEKMKISKIDILLPETLENYFLYYNLEIENNHSYLVAGEKDGVSSYFGIKVHNGIHDPELLACPK